MSHSVSSDLAGERADKVVATLCEVSRAEARRMVEEGAVVVDGLPVRPGTRLAAGATMEADLPEPAPTLQAEPVPFEVRYEDPEVLVIDKPAGVVVHPGAGTVGPTLAAGLIHRYPDLAALGEEHRWGIVHRLDRDTSGVLLVARTAAVHGALQEALARRTIRREYVALVHGSPASATGTIDAPIGRDPRQPTRMAVVPEGRPARTHYRRAAAWTGVAALRVRLETGRTHQIRVHLASVGHPLVGDPWYGRQPPLPPGIDPGRLWLHARRLCFRHPGTESLQDVSTPLPADLVASLAVLGEPVAGDLGALGTDSEPCA